MFYLSRYPKSYARVVDEIRSTFINSAEIKGGPILQSCVYLQACIDESMRISPPTTGCLWREVEQGGVTVAGLHIPTGCEIGCSTYALHHNEDYFHDSFTFSPERWLPAESKMSREQYELASRAYKPFSLGPRSCSGRAIALLQIKLTMAKLLWEMDFRPAKGELRKVGEGKIGAKDGRHRPHEYQLRTHITAVGVGPLLEFRSRLA